MKRVTQVWSAAFLSDVGKFSVTTLEWVQKGWDGHSWELLNSACTQVTKHLTSIKTYYTVLFNKSYSSLWTLNHKIKKKTTPAYLNMLPLLTHTGPVRWKWCFYRNALSPQLIRHQHPSPISVITPRVSLQVAPTGIRRALSSRWTLAGLEAGGSWSAADLCRETRTSCVKGHNRPGE